MRNAKAIRPLLLSMSVVCTLAYGLASAKESSESGAFLPHVHARMYHADSKTAWKAIVKTLRALYAAPVVLRREEGLLITGMASLSKLVSPPPTIENGYVGTRFQLFVFVSGVSGSTRIYVNSLIEAQAEDRLHRLRDAGVPPEAEAGFYYGWPAKALYNHGAVEEAYFGLLEDALGEKGEPVPRHPPLPGPEASQPELLPNSTKHLPNPTRAGSVLLRVLVSEDGVVEETEVLHSHPASAELEREAQAEVSIWRYRPAMRDGRPLPSWTNVVFGDSGFEPFAALPPEPYPDNPEPSYPSLALEAGVEGTVRYEASVSAAGRVEALAVLEVPREGLGFEDAVKATVSKWRFSPAIENGQPLASKYSGIASFRVNRPFDQARIYPRSAADVWGVLLQVFDELEIGIGRMNEQSGFAVTKALEQTVAKGIDPGFVGESIRLQLFIPKFTEPARVHLRSFVTSGTTGEQLGADPDGAQDVFARRVFEVLDGRLGVKGEGIPNDPERRRVRARDLGGQAGLFTCLDEVGDRAEARLPAISVSFPVRIPESLVRPYYPEDGLGQEVTLVFETTLSEDGLPEEMNLVRATSPNPAFEREARRAVSLWRYRPAMQGGCPVAVTFTIVVEFRTSP